jgi:hypothetical protein
MSEVQVSKASLNFSEYILKSLKNAFKICPIRLLIGRFGVKGAALIYVLTPLAFSAV